MMETVINNTLTVILIIMALLLLVCLIKAVIGPRVGDRLVCINMMGTVVIVIIAILALKLKEGYLVDSCVIYAMISFLAVIVLGKIYLGKYIEKSKNDKEDK